MSGKQSVLRTIVNRNVERQLVKEFLMENPQSAGVGGLTLNRTPNGTSVEIRAEKPGRVIGKRGKIINDLQKRLDEEFDLFNPRLSVEEVEDPTLNAQVMAQKIASALERGWYYRRAGASAAVNIMEKGARGVIVTVAGKLTGARNRTQKFILGHVKYCGETALEFMDKGYAVAVKKLGTIGVTVQIVRKGITLPHEISVFSEEELRIRSEQETAEVEVVEEASE